MLKILLFNLEATRNIGKTTAKNLGTDKRRPVESGINTDRIVYTASGSFKVFRDLIPIPNPKTVKIRSDKIVKLSGFTPKLAI